jgi:hypothetical protein
MTTARVLRSFSLLLILATLPHLLNAQTTVNLAASPNLTSIFGAPVTLGASVTPVTATGRLTFYDGATVLGTKTLSSGVASISTILLAPGSHKLRAYYSGDGSNPPGTSAVFTQTVNAQFSAGLALRSPVTTAAASMLAAGDFNGDGKADVVVRNPGALTVLLGDGAGGFQPSFTLATTGLSPSGAAVGDFNGDGKADLAVASSTSNNVTVLLGNGDGTFQAPANYAVPNPLQNLVVADFNGDGKADIATADPVSGVNVLLGKGDGSFQAAVPYVVNSQAGGGSQAAFVLVGDFNGDGKADLATVNANSSSLSILLGAGDGTFQPPLRVTIPGQALRLAVGDFNGDGKTDLATNNGHVLLGKGDGTFQTPVTYSTRTVASSVASGDVDGDGKADLIFGDGVVSVLLGKGDGTFQTALTYSAGSAASAILVGEFNNDGRTDVAVANGSAVSLLVGTTITVTATAGTPQSTTLRAPFPTPLQVTVKDGPNPVSGATVTFLPPSGAATDLAPLGSATAVLSSGTVLTDVNGVASVTATANSLAGSYQVTATSMGVSTTFSLTNLSGATSLITASPTSQSTAVGTAFPSPLQVTLKDPTGLPSSGVTVTFTPPPSGASATLSSPTAVTNASGVASVTATANNISGSYLVTAAGGGLSTSFSLTNLQNLTVTLSSSPNPSNLGSPVTLMASLSNPAASGRVTFFDGVSVLGVKTASVGLASITTSLLSPGAHKLTAYYRDDTTSTTGTSNIVTQTVRAAAGGAFFSQAAVSATPTSTTVAVGDFNGDGKADVAFPTFISGSSAVTVLLGVGDGTFQAAANYVLGTAGATAITAGDFNGDGNTDLAVATGSASVSILLGNGDGTFRAPVNYAGGSNSVGAMAVGDFNGDGRPDIVLAYSASHGVNILYGNGDGSFGPPTAYTTLSGPLAVADFNGDGKPDLALGNTSILNISSPSIVLGNGDGTTQVPIGISLGSGSVGISSLIAGDFNGDGKVDLAVGGVISGSAPSTWILLGNGDGTFQPPLSYSLGAAVASGDFNGDGFIDLVVADITGNTVGILQGRADGSFQTGPSISAGITMAVSDFNGDGKNDLFTANSNGTVNVVLGTNGVSFSVTATGGGGQSAPVGSPFATPLRVTVLNNGVALSGATVNFSAPASGASATLSSPTAVTSAAGVASINATANQVAGSYVVTATYQGVSATFTLTNTSVGTVTATGGTPQSTAVGVSFTAPLQVFVRDGLGNPVNGVTVTFAAPPTGASATLSSSIATTNASGLASVSATANAIAGSYSVTATVGGLSASFALTNTAGAPASIAAAGGATQTALLGNAFATPLQVTVRDSNGNLVSGATVNFQAPGSGASATLSSPSALTNAAGVASVTATANTVTGSYAVTATLGAFSATFTLTNVAIASVTAAGGTPQTALLGSPFATALQALVKDNVGNPVSGLTVTFAAPPTGASATLSSPTATTNAAGIASVTATANITLGTYTVTASVGALTASFTLTNSSATAASITATGGTPQTSLVGLPFPNALQVTVRDANGLPVSGATVFFTAPAIGASAILSSPTATTNAAGVASVTATANNIAGSYTVTAGVGGLTAFFVLNNSFSSNTNLALGRTASQSSTLPGTPSASVAVDGNTDGNFFDGSVTATNLDTNAWWQVDLGASAAINTVAIFNRTDCCASRLTDFWVFVSNTPFLPTDTPATLQNRAGTFASHQTTAPNPSTTIAVGGAAGRYVRVQLSGTDYLSLAEVQVTGTGGAPPPTNLSMGKPASQSSTIPGTPGASVAVDGNTDGNFYDGSVTATNADPNAWWQVDLSASSTVNSVVIWNRTDCCGSRLNDFWVFVSNTPFLATDTPATLQNRAGTFAIHLAGAPNPSTSIPIGAQGRYVRVQLNGTNNLSLAEVQVFGNGPAAVNLSQGRVAVQSSTLPGSLRGASAAIDGNTDGNYFNGSVTATNQDTNAWWQVDLGASSTISSVVIYNRTDCCASRLSDFWVFISDIPFLTSDTPATLQNRPGTFASHQTIIPNPSITIPFTAQGRYVRVQLSGTDYLSLAEVQVFGLGAPAPANLSQGKVAAQSSIAQGAVLGFASAAVDGNTDGNFYDGSVTATNLDPNSWWQVDLGASAAVSSITIFNRTDCCSSRLNDYWIFVSDSPYLSNDSPATLQNRAGTFAIHQTTTPNPAATIPIGAQGRYVRIQLSSPNYLSLAEVQVFGQ